jgi:hypothetical protein
MIILAIFICPLLTGPSLSNLTFHTLPSQFFDAMRKELARLNGPDGKGGVFEDLEAHFILCSDEACLMAEQGGGREGAQRRGEGEAR